MGTDSAERKKIDAYIAAFPPDVRAILKKIRATIKKATPAAEEKFSYQMPAFVLHGNLVYFAAHKNHIGFYPAPSGTAKFNQQLAAYKSGKGSAQFPFERPIPYGLIRQIVKFRVKENLGKAKKKRRK